MHQGLTSIVLLLMSLAALGLGPLLYRWLQAHRGALRALDGIVTVGVGGLILLHVLPPAVQVGGMLALVFVMAGMILPTAIERFQHGRFEGAHRAATVLAAVALVVHAMTDGLALSQGDSSAMLPMALAVVLHRLPVGLAIWMVFRPEQGKTVAWIILGMIFAGTVVGFVAGAPLVAMLQGEAFAWAQAFVAGSLLHVLFHAHEHDHDHGHGHRHGHGHGHGHRHTHSHAHASTAGQAGERRPAVFAPGAGGVGPSSTRPLMDVGKAIRSSELRFVAAPAHIETPCCAPDEWDRPGLSGRGRLRAFFGVDAMRAQAPEILGAILGALIVAMLAWVESHSSGHAHSEVSTHNEVVQEHAGHDHAGHDHAGHDHPGHDHAGHDHAEGLPAESAAVGHAHVSVIDAEGWTRILELALGSAPALFMGYLLAGLICVWLRPQSLAWLNAGSPTQGAFRGVIFGFPKAVRACSVVPVYDQLMERGARPSGGISFLVSSPHLRPEALILSIPLLGLPLAGIRVVSVVLMAVVLGLWVAWRVPAVSGSQSQTREPSLGLWSGLRHGLFRIVDDTAPWVVVAYLTVGLVGPSSLQFFAEQPVFVEVVFFAMLGIPVYLCSSASMPVSSLLIAAGVSPGAALAFVLMGPAANVAVFASLRDRYGRGLALTVLVAFFAMIVGCGLVTEWAFSEWIVRTQPDLVHGASSLHEHRAGNVLQWVALGAVGVLFMGSLLRRGPRAWLNTVVAGDHG